MMQKSGSSHAATAVAHSNIALVKYWGKRDTELNLPAVGSLSITLGDLATTTSIRFDANLDSDQLVLNGSASTRKIELISSLLDHFRQLAGVREYAAIETANNFPTAAGLASSASGFAALVYAANAALNLDVSRRELTRLARQGSGSAARSIDGGFVLLHKGDKDDGSDCYAEPLLDREAWPLEVVIAITTHAEKKAASTAGMEDSRRNSPYYQPWIESHGADLAAAQEAVAQQDFERLAEVSESSCLKMHALMLATPPGLIYWNAASTACIHAIRELRAEAVPVFFTIDAGPQIKAVCAPGYSTAVAERLAQIDGVAEIRKVGLGPAAYVVD